MPRKPKTEATVIDVQANVAVIAEGSDAQNQLAELEQTAIDNTAALAKKFGYTGSIDPDALQADTYAKGCAAQQAFYQFGVSLLLLRERTMHGNWQQRLEQMNIARRTAHNYIAATLRVMNSDVPEALQRIGMSKILELQTLEPEEFKSLEAGETVRGITLEATESMSRAELRAKLKEAQENIEDKDKAIAKWKAAHNSKNEELITLQTTTGAKIAADTDWPDALTPITDQVAAAGRAIAKAISDLETCRITLMETGQALEADLQPKYEAALGHVVEVYEAALGKAERDIQKERVTFDKSLGAYGDAA